MIGNSQMLDLPVNKVYNFLGSDLATYNSSNGKTVPYGKIWQYVSHSGEKVTDGYQRNDYGDKYPLNAVLHIDADNGRVLVQNLKLTNYFVLAEGTTLFISNDVHDSEVISIIEYNLNYPENEKNEETTVSLNLPVSEVINIVGGDFFYGQTDGIYVPNGKVLQLVGIGGGQDSDWANFRVINNNKSYEGKLEVGFVFSSDSEVYLNSDNWYSSLFSFVMYDLDTQNLAYNVPKQTTPTLYPNPTSSLLALNSDKEYDIEVYDMAGNKVMALTGNTIDMSHLSSATYIVKALDKVKNEEVSYKVVKN
jgi:hypothetical protein